MLRFKAKVRHQCIKKKEIKSTCMRLSGGGDSNNCAVNNMLLISHRHTHTHTHTHPTALPPWTE